MRPTPRMVAVAALALCAGAALAQINVVTQQQVTGNECWNAGQGPGGPSQFLCLNTVRGSAPNVVTSGISGSFTIGGAGTNTSALVDGGNLLVAAQPLAATITLPPNPIADGAIIGYCNVTGSAFATNAVTFSANSGQTLNTAVTLTTQAAGTCAKVQWSQSQASWYRIQ